MKLFIKSLVSIVFINLAVLGIMCAAVKKPWVALFNGCSSAGKTTIVNEIRTRVPAESLVVVKFDEKVCAIVVESNAYLLNKARELQTTVDALPQEILRENANQIDRREFQAKLEMRDEVTKFLKEGRNVIVDTILGDGDLGNTQVWMQLFKNCAEEGNPVFFVLVYCPLSMLADRIRRRNMSGDSLENRKLDQVFELFSSLYSPSQPNLSTPYLPPCLEELDQGKLTAIVKDAQLSLNQGTIISFVKRFVGSGYFNPIKIYPTLCYTSILMNDGTKTPAELADLFLEQTSRVDLVKSCRIAEGNRLLAWTAMKTGSFL